MTEIVPVRKIVEDGSGELTLAPDDRSALFHVSYSEATITVGWSTTCPLDVCFQTAVSVALSTDADLAHAEHVREFVQRSGRIELGEFTISNLSDLAERAASLAADGVTAARMDVGRWSWEWDDLSETSTPLSHRFGGLTDSGGGFTGLEQVVAELGDEWVRAHLGELIGQAADFLTQRQR